MKEFLQGRWKGIRPVLMGRTLREAEMTRGLYELNFNVTGDLVLDADGNAKVQENGGNAK